MISKSSYPHCWISMVILDYLRVPKTVLANLQDKTMVWRTTFLVPTRKNPINHRTDKVTMHVFYWLASLFWLVIYIYINIYLPTGSLVPVLRRRVERPLVLTRCPMWCKKSWTRPVFRGTGRAQRLGDWDETLVLNGLEMGGCDDY